MGMPWTPQERSLLATRYSEEGSLALALQLGRSPDSVSSQARRYGLTSQHARRRQAATRVSRSHSVDLRFFDRMSADVAYALGVIWACGSVKQKHRCVLRICLPRDRVTVIRRVQSLMASRHSLQCYPDTRVLEIPNSLLVRSLLAIHGFPPKSAREPRPPAIDGEWLNPFALGHLAATSHHRSDHIHWLGCEAVMTWLAKAIRVQTGVGEPGVMVRNRREQVIRWQSTDEVRVIRGWLGISD